MSGANNPSQRQLRVGEQIRQAITETLAKGKFRNEILLDYSHYVTVSEVRPSPDLKYANVYVMTLGGMKFDEVLEALNATSAYISHDIGKKMTQKFTPRLRFIKDESFEEASKINGLINEVKYSNEE